MMIVKNLSEELLCKKREEAMLAFSNGRCVKMNVQKKDIGVLIENGIYIVKLTGEGWVIRKNKIYVCICKKALYHNQDGLFPVDSEGDIYTSYYTIEDSDNEYYCEVYEVNERTNKSLSFKKKG